MNVPAKIENDFTFWKGALTALQQGQPIQGITEDDPQPGYYRVPRKGRQAESATYWRDSHDGSLRCQVNGRDVEEMRALELWPYAAKQPVSEKWFDEFARTGKWPDMSDVVAATLPNPREKIGGNSPPAEFELAKEQIETARKGVEDYRKIKDATTAAGAQSLRARLLELAGAVGKARLAETLPLRNQVGEINARWGEIETAAQSGADVIRAALKNYHDELDRKAEEANRRAAEKAQVKAEATGKPQPVATPPVAATPTVVKGAYGRAASVGKKNVVTVEDQEKVYNFFRDNADLKALLQKLAQKSVDAGAPVPGVSVTKENNIR